MTRNILFFILLLTGSFTNGQIVNIPDTNFKAALLNHNPVIDINSDNEIQVTEAISFTGTVNVEENNISDLTGIEAFISIAKLWCNDNHLTSLILSENILLIHLNCHNNNLTVLEISNCASLINLNCMNNYISSLDISNNNSLTGLNCNNNLLSEIDLSHNLSLVGIDCAENPLNALDINSNTELLELRCYNNQLSTLNISNNINLVTLWCHSNSLSTLDISNNLSVENLSCGSNNLNSLNISINTCLTTLSCGFNSLNNIDVSNNAALINLFCFGNQLATLDLSNNINLDHLHCSDNQINSLDLSSNSELRILYCYNNKLKSLNVKNGNNSNFTSFSAYDNDSLFCIEVDDPNWCTSNWTEIDSVASFSNNCHYSISEMQKNNLKVYPNPFKESIKILVSNRNFADLEIKIYNILGVEHMVNIIKSDDEVIIQCNNYNDGIYVLKIFDQNYMIECLKLIKE